MQYIKHGLVAVALLASTLAVAQNKKPATGDADALAVVATVDRDEIKMAKQAQAKKVGKAAMEYAKMMEREHGDNLAQTQALEKKPASDPSAAKAVAQKDAKKHAELAAMNGAAYEKAYIDAMVAGHAEVLAKLDNELIPGASDAAVKAHLTKTRDAVSRHLDAAKALQTK